MTTTTSFDLSLKSDVADTAVPVPSIFLLMLAGFGAAPAPWVRRHSTVRPQPERRGSFPSP